MMIDHPNFSIIVNWKSKGFGCAKVCPYCTWRDSSLLPHGAQSTDTVSTFVRQCQKRFVSISGGADPLYKFDEYRSQLQGMIDTIKQEGYKVRVITRELAHIEKLRHEVDFVSISLDEEVLASIERYRDGWHGMDIEYSLVLPPLPTAEIAKLRPQYTSLQCRLGGRLVLRENLNSVFPLDLSLLSFGHRGIAFVPKRLCLAGRYLSTVDCVGHDIVQDNEALACYLMNHPGVHLFGGFAKHLADPVHAAEYGDIDLIATDAGVMQELEERFGYRFREMSQLTSRPRYFLGKSTKAGKSIHLVLLGSDAEALLFIHNAQYDIDRFAYHVGRFHPAPGLSMDAVRGALRSKQATRAGGPRYMGLYTPSRTLVEQKHKAKLLTKGYTVIERAN
jgi:hypothetical protein